MASDASTERVEASSASGAEASLIDAVDDTIFGRRQFLKGLGIGGAVVGGSGLGVAHFSDDDTVQPLATLAGGVATPAPTRYHLPAVDGTERGLVVMVDIAVTDDRDGLFVNLDGIEVRHDLQTSLREAMAKAQEVTERTVPSGVLVSFSAATDGILALRGKSWEAGLAVGFAGTLTGDRRPEKRS